MCRRRSVQSRQSRQKRSRVERRAGSAIPNSVRKLMLASRNFGVFFVEHDVSAGDQWVGEINTQATRNVVVANSGRADCFRLRGQRTDPWRRLKSDGDDSLNHLRHLR